LVRRSTPTRGSFLRTLQPLTGAPVRLACTLAFSASLSITLAVTGCTASPDKTTPMVPSVASSQEASAPEASQSGSTAEEQLKKHYPAVESATVTGSGQMEPIVANSVPGKPYQSGTVDFLFTCTGNSIVSISVWDRSDLIPGAAGSLRCGPTAFKRSFPVTTKSQLSFRAEATTVADGDFAFAYVGDIR
jgi:hypothetical protein